MLSENTCAVKRTFKYKDNPNVNHYIHIVSSKPCNDICKWNTV